jgi:hypothetical protein
MLAGPAYDEGSLWLESSSHDGPADDALVVVEILSMSYHQLIFVAQSPYLPLR